jgi:hypothetical protein
MTSAQPAILIHSGLMQVLFLSRLVILSEAKDLVPIAGGEPPEAASGPTLRSGRQDRYDSNFRTRATARYAGESR